MQNFFYLICFPLESFKKGIYEKPYNLRINWLKEIYNKFLQKSTFINLIESIHVDLDTELGMEKFKSFNKKSIIDGYEGIMIKDPKSYYECKRSTTWLKSKPSLKFL